MTILLSGIALLAAMIGLFYLKDRFESPRLARIAHSELMMRFTVIAAVMIFVGILLVVGQLLP